MAKAAPKPASDPNFVDHQPPKPEKREYKGGFFALVDHATSPLMLVAASHGAETEVDDRFQALVEVSEEIGPSGAAEDSMPYKVLKRWKPEDVKGEADGTLVLFNNAERRWYPCDPGTKTDSSHTILAKMVEPKTCPEEGLPKSNSVRVKMLRKYYSIPSTHAEHYDKVKKEYKQGDLPVPTK